MKIAIIGLGYVGLPLAIEFSKKNTVIGFDINQNRVDELNKGLDITNETTESEINNVLSKVPNGKNGLFLTTDAKYIKDAQIYIVTVPTPITSGNKPNLNPLRSASKIIGKVLSVDDIVIYESTVYPGCTEEECVPVLEMYSGLKYNQDFYCGYSPERINPGDKINTLTKIKKVTSGSNPEIAKIVDDLYKSIIEAGTHLTSSIKVAEASKVIENAQRDVNISFINELALIFDKIGIDTNEVLDAAATKWNFLHYKPGLVGGHCISVDPYYLAYKAEELGYHPAVLLSGRRVNDQMGRFVASKVIKLMINKGFTIMNSRILLLGITFKENCPDIRNSKVIDVYNELLSFGANVDVLDPLADPVEVRSEFNIGLIKEVDQVNYDAVIFAVSHSEFYLEKYQNLVIDERIIFDLKNMLDSPFVDSRL
jgi:UDP-N-acetyl-D-galactosamine dehydrogenase